MAFRVEAKIDGIDGLVAKLKDLRASLQRKVLRSAMRKSASVINKSAKGMAPRRTGQLRRSLGVAVKAYPSGVVIGVVEPRAGFKIQIPAANGRMKNIDPRYYAHLVEKGTKPHAVGKGSRTRGRKASQAGRLHPGAKAQPFLLPAFTMNQARVIAIFEEEIEKALAAV